jgi:hypothetical protein
MHSVGGLPSIACGETATATFAIGQSYDAFSFKPALPKVTLTSDVAVSMGT